MKSLPSFSIADQSCDKKSKRSIILALPSESGTRERLEETVSSQEWSQTKSSVPSQKIEKKKVYQKVSVEIQTEVLKSFKPVPFVLEKKNNTSDLQANVSNYPVEPLQAEKSNTVSEVIRDISPKTSKNSEATLSSNPRYREHTSCLAPLGWALEGAKSLAKPASLPLGRAPERPCCFSVSSKNTEAGLPTYTSRVPKKTCCCNNIPTKNSDTSKVPRTTAVSENFNPSTSNTAEIPLQLPN